MKKLQFIFILCLFQFAYSFAQQYGWVVIDPNTIPGTPNLSDISFISADTGWINSNTTTTIFKTTDGGNNFSTQSIASTIDAIHMTDANEGYAAADDGTIYRTASGGTNWASVGFTFANLNDITFPRSGPTSTGYACSDDGGLYSVTSGGVASVTSGVVSDLNSLTFPTDTQGWVCGESVILHFIGGTWQGGQSYPSGTYNAIYFVDNQNGWAVGDNGIIIHTNDGQNWIAQTNPDSNSLFDVFFLNTSEGWAVGGNGAIVHTTNGGTTWAVEGSGLTTSLLTGVQFASSTNGYVVGNNKTLLKYTNLVEIEDNVSSINFKVFPNPTSKLVHIQCSEFKIKDGAAEILSIDGKTMIKQSVESGNETIEFDVSELAKGTYLCTIVIEDKTSTKKLIIE